jgi:SAM-dependent methyltransferase
MIPDMIPDITYETYAQDPNYIAANQALIDAIDLADVSRVADLACGTGLLSRMLRTRAPGLAICGIDLDPVQIGLARRAMEAAAIPLADTPDALAPGMVHLRTASAMELPFEDAGIDLVIMGNAIHMMPDRAAFLAEVARVLRPGGRFSFNSVFYAGTFVPGTEHIWTECMKEAVIVLGEMNAARRAAGAPPVPRQRGTAQRAFRQTEWLDAAGWGGALADAGLHVTTSGERPVPISMEGLQAITAYGGLAEVLMSGYPVDIAAVCLQQGIARAFAGLGIQDVPRNWLEVAAVRR